MLYPDKISIEQLARILQDHPWYQNNTEKLISEDKSAEQVKTLLRPGQYRNIFELLIFIWCHNNLTVFDTNGALIRRKEKIKSITYQSTIDKKALISFLKERNLPSRDLNFGVSYLFLDASNDEIISYLTAKDILIAKYNASDADMSMWVWSGELRPLEYKNPINENKIKRVCFHYDELSSLEDMNIDLLFYSKKEIEMFNPSSRWIVYVDVIERWEPFFENKEAAESKFNGFYKLNHLGRLRAYPTGASIKKGIFKISDLEWVEKEYGTTLQKNKKKNVQAIRLNKEISGRVDSYTENIEKPLQWKNDPRVKDSWKTDP